MTYLPGAAHQATLAVLVVLPKGPGSCLPDVARCLLKTKKAKTERQNDVL